jgi:hypothetical protein
LAFDLEQMKSALNGGGDRPSKFFVQMVIPGVASGDAAAMEKLTMTCSGASIPPMINGVISVPYFGRDVKVTGDKVFPEWTLTIINDEDYLVRRVVERWSHGMNANRRNTTVAPFGSNPSSYKTDAYVYKVGKEGQYLRNYKLVGCWPSMVGQIDLNWGDRDRIAEWQLTLQYDYWVNDVDILEGDGMGLSLAG